MKNHYITVVNNIATYSQRSGYILLGKDDNHITFVFDSKWDNLPNKIARFKWNEGYIDIPIDNNTVKVPTLEKISAVEVGVYVEGLYATTPAVIPCREGGAE